MARRDAQRISPSVGLALFLVALAVRLIYVWDVWHSPLSAALLGDGREYDAWAQRIVAGQWLGSDVFYQAPLYPYLLAVVFRIFGHDLFVVRVLQATSSAAACVLLARTGCCLFDRRVGIAAGTLMALYAPSLFFDGLIQKSSLDFFLMTVVLYALAEWSVRPRARMAALSGVALGLLAMTRENARVLIPVLAGWLLIRREARAAVVFVLALLAVLLPVGFRNYAVGGEFLISTSQAGPNFYIGNHSGASGLYESLLPERGSVKYERDDATRLAQEAMGRPLSPSEVSNYWVTRAVDDIRASPRAWAALIGKKLMLSINAAEAPDTESLPAYEEYSLMLRSVAWINFGVLLVFAVFGMWLERARWRQLAVLYAVILSLLGSVIAFFVVARYRFPLAPPLALFAAVPMVRAFSLSWSRRTDWLPGVVLAGLAAVGAWWPLDVGADETYLNAGKQLIADGRPREAIPILQRSVARDPSDPRHAVTLGVAHGALALALMKSGLTREAIDHFASSVATSPADAALRTNYGVALLQNDKAEEAVAQLREAVRLAPSDAVAATAFGSALGQSGHLEEAIASFQAAVQLDPGNARSHANLGLALAQAGREVEATPHLERAVALDPRFIEAESALAELYARQGRRADAVAALRRALSVATAEGRSEAVNTLRLALARLGES